MMSQMVGRAMGCKIETAYYKWNSSDQVENWGGRLELIEPLEEKKQRDNYKR